MPLGLRYTFRYKIVSIEHLYTVDRTSGNLSTAPGHNACFPRHQSDCGGGRCGQRVYRHHDGREILSPIIFARIYFV